MRCEWCTTGVWRAMSRLSANRTRSCRCLSVSDLFLLPSAQESFGLAALEAMACEVPVVASRVGGLPEVVEHGVSGFLCEPEDIEGMAKARHGAAHRSRPSRNVRQGRARPREASLLRGQGRAAI